LLCGAEPIDMLPTVQADTPIAAVAKLAREGKLPAAGSQFWVRIVIESNGTSAKAISVPLTPQYEVPLDWHSPEDFEQ